MSKSASKALETRKENERRRATKRLVLGFLATVVITSVTVGIITFLLMRTAIPFVAGDITKTFTKQQENADQKRQKQIEIAYAGISVPAELKLDGKRYEPGRALERVTGYLEYTYSYSGNPVAVVQSFRKALEQVNFAVFEDASGTGLSAHSKTKGDFFVGAYVTGDKVIVRVSQ